MTVLLVEDSEVVREGLVNLLRQHLPAPVDILHATNPEDALLHLRAWAPHVVLLDLQLEQGNGMDVLEVMKAENITAPVVVLTNHSLPQVRQRCLQAGARCFFDKSLEFDLAVAAVRALAKERRGGCNS